MFTHYRTEGVVIKRIERGEADFLLVVYTKDFGRIEVIARGARKIASKLRPAVEFVAVIEIEFIQGKACKTLTDAVIINSLGGARKDLVKSAVLRQICDFAEMVVKDQQEDARTWDLISSTFAFIGSVSSKSCIAVYHFFVWHLMEVSGWRPDFNERMISAENLALVKIFRDADIDQSAKMRLGERQDNLLLEVAEKYLSFVTE